MVTFNDVTLNEASRQFCDALERGATAKCGVLFLSVVRCLDESPCDPDITPKQRQAWKELEEWLGQVPHSHTKHPVILKGS